MTSPTPIIKNGTVKSNSDKDFGLVFDETSVRHYLVEGKYFFS